MQLFLPWSVVGCLGAVLLEGEEFWYANATHLHLAREKLRLREEACFAQVPTAVGDGLGRT